MAARWRLIFWRWAGRVHDRLHEADRWASGLSHRFPDYDYPNENYTFNWTR